MFNRRNVFFGVLGVVGVGLLGYGVRRYWNQKRED